MTVKILLKQIREERRLSQNKLAQLMEMSLQNMQRIEYGDAKSIPLATLDKLCGVLNCQPGDLLIRVTDLNRDQENILIEQILRGLKVQKVEQVNSESNESTKVNRSNSLATIDLIPNSA